MSADSTDGPEGREAPLPVANSAAGDGEVFLERAAKVLNHLRSLLLQLESESESSKPP